jgi:lipopolysaccharide biosynthesis glycosyltransferase
MGLSKKAIVTICVGSLFEQMSKMTHPLLKSYADDVKADFIVLNDVKTYQHPHYLKFELHNMLQSGEYNRILFIDTDVVVKRGSPNLFAIVPKDKLGAYEEGHIGKGNPATDKRMCMRSYCRYYNIEMEKQKLRQVNLNGWNEKYYNSGVFLVNKDTNPFVPALGGVVKIGGFFDQDYFNLMIHEKKIPVQDIGFKFNHFPWGWVDSKSKDITKNCYFMHYAGLKNRVERMTADLKRMEYDI